MDIGMAYLTGDTSRQVASYPLQDILLPIDKALSELYIRFLSGYAEIGDNSLAMGKGAKLSFNTYFNSFYESYWRECTDVTNVSLEIEFSGRLIIEIYRDTKYHGCQRIQWRKLRHAGLSTATIDVPGSFSEPGRIFLDVTAYRKSEIHRIAFKTTIPPRHSPTITLGICTFNREPFLYRNLKAIQSNSDVAQAIEKIIVVNQGPSFANKDLVALVEQSDLVKVVEQRNLGGCGGFTRTMHESLEHHDATHHVLMDDDASIDERILKNLKYFLSYASQDIVVGGHMLDLLRPWVLYEAGAVVEANSRIKSLHHNVDLRAIDSLIPFNQCHYSDYNAWWFCAMPTKHIEEAQFPAPIFIRGDDIEYGIRLQERGIKTVAMPGIAVWHEPFYVKIGGWQTYYDLRNRLILASIYPNRFELEPPKVVLWLMMQALALHDYMSAQLLCKAVHDFLKGPALFEKDAELIHKEVAALAKSLGQPSAASTEGIARLANPKPMPQSEVLMGLLVFVRIVAALLRGSAKNKPILLMDHEADVRNVSPGPYVKTNGVGSYRLLYTPDRKQLMKALLMCFKSIGEYLLSRKAASICWISNIEKLRSSTRWVMVFNDIGLSAGSCEVDRPKCPATKE